ncbi:Phytanoyl-CoA dioxygenase (PhyH) [Pseudovibrio ascidiaceicola]|uniref:Phytanoyl-CoA dioxygenase (PhyH) n=2 Tax=Pseudovibrio ascidiaceicola TaxID=285279 RepID=A0A1I3XP48_9HYPH|nr:Phytanoyl-CoA dioxygenase (PhyH) [Pseudovibrio ascidiaceicola]
MRMRAIKPKHLMNSLQRRFLPSSSYQSEWDEGTIPSWFHSELTDLHSQKIEKQAKLYSTLPLSCAQTLQTHGIWIKHDVLPREFFRRLKFEAFDYFVGQRDRNKRLLSNWHNSQSFTLPLNYTHLLRQPFLQSAITDELIPPPLQFSAGRKAKPAYHLEAMAQCTPSFRFETEGSNAPPFEIEHDAFSPGAIALLFLEKITPEDGAMFYIPGSHRMTEQRIFWEYQRHLDYTEIEEEDDEPITGLSDLQDLDLPPLLPLKVEANTLLIMDRTGFHGRLPSTNNARNAHTAHRLALRADLSTKSSTRNN